MGSTAASTADVAEVAGGRFQAETSSAVAPRASDDTPTVPGTRLWFDSTFDYVRKLPWFNSGGPAWELHEVRQKFHPDFAPPTEWHFCYRQYGGYQGGFQEKWHVEKIWNSYGYKLVGAAESKGPRGGLQFWLQWEKRSRDAKRMSQEPRDVQTDDPEDEMAEKRFKQSIDDARSLAFAIAVSQRVPSGGSSSEMEGSRERSRSPPRADRMLAQTMQQMELMDDTSDP